MDSEEGSLILRVLRNAVLSNVASAVLNDLLAFLLGSLKHLLFSVSQRV